MASSEPTLRRTDATRRAIVDTAERLVAERGIGAVSLREISAAAGQKNHSAAQYHFGSREGLVDAVIAARSEPVDVRRRELLEALDRDLALAVPAEPVRRLVEVLVRPWAECLLPQEESHYLRFLARCMDDPESRTALRSSHIDPPAAREANDRLAALLAGAPRRDVVRRLEWVASVSLNALADVERRGVHDPAEIDAVCDDLIAMLTALLSQ